MIKITLGRAEKWLVSCWLYGHLTLFCSVAYADDVLEELWLAAKLNQMPQTTTLLFLRQTDGRLLIASQDWQQWRLKLPTTPVVRHNDENYYYLDQLQGISYQVNEVDLSIALTADVSLFESIRLTGLSQNQAIDIQTLSGGFINYDLSTHLASEQSSTNVFLEGVLFSRRGVLENQVLALNIDQATRRSIRLDTTFTQDNITKSATLRIGDTMSSDLGLNGNVHLAGLQWATNFGLQPNRLTFPLPAMSGQAVLPSTVDIFVNNARSVSRHVPTGDFTIQDIPVISGKGEARMVIKDILGREQVVTLPYYATSKLLQTGLQEYAYELGVVREDYGLKNQNYGQFLASGLYRLGLSSSTTAELQIQASKEQQRLSYGGVLVWPRFGMMQALMANSWHEQYGEGYATQLAITGQLSAVNVGTNVRFATDGFSDLGRVNGGVPTKLIEQMFLSVPLPWKLGVLNTSYTYQTSYANDTSSILQLGYHANWGKWATFSASLSHFLEPKTQTAVQFSISTSLGKVGTANLQVEPQSHQQSVRLQRSMPAGIGWGYDLSGSFGQSQRFQAVLNAQNSIGGYKIRASQQTDTAFEVGMTGAIAVVDKNVFLSRRLSSSFAVVKVGDFANVRVYKQNQLVGKTRSNGTLLVSQLLPYQKNKLNIDGGDLPFDVDIPSIEKFVIPAFRSAVNADFVVKMAYGATLTIVSEDGEVLPAGAIITKDDESETFLVGYRGEAYLTNLKTHNMITVHWLNKTCQFQLFFEPTKDKSVPDLGRQICKSVKS